MPSYTHFLSAVCIICGTFETKLNLCYASYSSVIERMNVSCQFGIAVTYSGQPQFIIPAIPNYFVFIFPHSLQVNESIIPNVRPQAVPSLPFSIGHSLEEEMLSFQSNATCISFRGAGYIFRINEWIHHHVLYKISSKNKVMTCQFEYICFFFVFYAFLTVHLSIILVIDQLNAQILVL